MRCARNSRQQYLYARGRGGSRMSRRVKEFVDVADHVSIDELIQKLSEIRDSLPDEAGAELRLRGDDVFGHRITVSYFRDQTKEEAEIEAALCRGGARSQGARACKAAGRTRARLLRSSRQAREAEDCRLARAGAIQRGPFEAGAVKHPPSDHLDRRCRGTAERRPEPSIILKITQTRTGQPRRRGAPWRTPSRRWQS